MKLPTYQAGVVRNLGRMPMPQADPSAGMFARGVGNLLGIGGDAATRLLKAEIDAEVDKAATQAQRDIDAAELQAKSTSSYKPESAPPGSGATPGTNGMIGSDQVHSAVIADRAAKIRDKYAAGLSHPMAQAAFKSKFDAIETKAMKAAGLHQLQLKHNKIVGHTVETAAMKAADATLGNIDASQDEIDQIYMKAVVNGAIDEDDAIKAANAAKSSAEQTAYNKGIDEVLALQESDPSYTVEDARNALREMKAAVDDNELSQLSSSARRTVRDGLRRARLRVTAFDKSRSTENHLAKERARKEREANEKAQRTTEENNLIRRWHDPKLVKPTVMDVVNSSLLPATKRTLIKGLEDEAKGKTVETNWPKYNDAFAGIVSGKIQPDTMEQLVLPMVGKHIKAEDYSRLRTLSDSLHKQGVGAQFSKFETMARSQLTLSNQVFADPGGDKNYYNFTVALQKAIEEKGKRQITLEQMLDPNHEEYLGKLVDGFKRTKEEIRRDQRIERERFRARGGKTRAR